MDISINIFQRRSLMYCSILVIGVFILSIFVNKGVEDFIFSLFIPLILLLFSFSFYNKNKHLIFKKYLKKLIIIVFLLKIVSIVVFTNILEYYIGIPFLSFKDDYLYYDSAVEIARLWKANNRIFLVEDVYLSKGFYSGYPNISALCIYYFGESVYVLRMANVIASCFIVYYMCKTMLLLASEKFVKFSISIVAFSPLLIYFSSFILKDIMLLLFTIVVIYGFVKILLNKTNIRLIVLVVLCLVLMIFFRAATIIPLFLAFVLTYLVSFFRFKKRFSYISIVFILFIFFAFLNFWDYISTYEIINDTETYYSPRLEFFATRDVTSAGSNLSRLNILSVLGLPIFIIASIFLPTFLFVNLGNAETINYNASALLYQLAILPFLVAVFVYSIKNIKKINPEVIFIMLVFVFFKIGLAVSINSLFSSRQSLGAIFSMYLLLPLFFQYNVKFRYLNNYFVIAVVVLLMFNFLRLFIRL